tara:strand:+ start:477 stop:644 length:168 start_codon:yes stop_codon:yes gene_type:complete
MSPATICAAIFVCAMWALGLIEAICADRGVDRLFAGIQAGVALWLIYNMEAWLAL